MQIEYTGRQTEVAAAAAGAWPSASSRSWPACCAGSPDVHVILTADKHRQIAEVSRALAAAST